MSNPNDDDMEGLYYADGYVDACEGNEPGTSWHGDDDTDDSLWDAYDAGYNDGKS
ncbi:hypothetical protein I5I61_10250 [Pseudomonas nitroreducens]|uniref:Uncharacterized protein n=1 Tax=Pseudomonas nitroreducens TaxID=46680 RepID=A0ABS0KKD6_PSENT|nr:hypothetical protein [Pseudomonas nitroreducens]MBG6287825.1 hypothetical protein [Pseudomonas nitroreducens]